MPTFSMRICYIVIIFIVVSVYLAELAYSAFKRMWKGDPQIEEEQEELLGNVANWAKTVYIILH